MHSGHCKAPHGECSSYAALCASGSSPQQPQPPCGEPDLELEVAAKGAVRHGAQVTLLHPTNAQGRGLGAANDSDKPAADQPVREDVRWPRSERWAGRSPKAASDHLSNFGVANATHCAQSGAFYAMRERPKSAAQTLAGYTAR